MHTGFENYWLGQTGRQETPPNLTKNSTPRHTLSTVSYNSYKPVPNQTQHVIRAGRYPDYVNNYAPPQNNGQKGQVTTQSREQPSQVYWTSSVLGGPHPVRPSFGNNYPQQELVSSQSRTIHYTPPNSQSWQSNYDPKQIRNPDLNFNHFYTGNCNNNNYYFNNNNNNNNGRNPLQDDDSSGKGKPARIRVKDLFSLNNATGRQVVGSLYSNQGQYNCSLNYMSPDNGSERVRDEYWKEQQEFLSTAGQQQPFQAPAYPVRMERRVVVDPRRNVPAPVTCNSSEVSGNYFVNPTTTAEKSAEPCFDLSSFLQTTGGNSTLPTSTQYQGSSQKGSETNSVLADLLRRKSPAGQNLGSSSSEDKNPLESDNQDVVRNKETPAVVSSPVLLDEDSLTEVDPYSPPKGAESHNVVSNKNRPVDSEKEDLGSKTGKSDEETSVKVEENSLEIKIEPESIDLGIAESQDEKHEDEIASKNEEDEQKEVKKEETEENPESIDLDKSESQDENKIDEKNREDLKNENQDGTNGAEKRKVKKEKTESIDLDEIVGQNQTKTATSSSKKKKERKTKKTERKDENQDHRQNEGSPSKKREEQKEGTKRKNPPEKSSCLTDDEIEKSVFFSKKPGPKSKTMPEALKEAKSKIKYFEKLKTHSKKSDSKGKRDDSELEVTYENTINRDKLDLLKEYLKTLKDKKLIELESPMSSENDSNDKAKNEEVFNRRRKLSKNSVVRNRNHAREMISLISYKCPRVEITKCSSQSPKSKDSSPDSGEDAERATQKPGSRVSTERECENHVRRNSTDRKNKPPQEDSSKDKPKSSVLASPKKKENFEETAIINTMRAFQNLEYHYCMSCELVSSNSSFWINVVSAELRCSNCFVKIASKAAEKGSSKMKHSVKSKEERNKKEEGGVLETSKEPAHPKEKSRRENCGPHHKVQSVELNLVEKPKRKSVSNEDDEGSQNKHELEEAKRPGKRKRGLLNEEWTIQREDSAEDFTITVEKSVLEETTKRKEVGRQRCHSAEERTKKEKKFNLDGSERARRKSSKDEVFLVLEENAKKDKSSTSEKLKRKSMSDEELISQKEVGKKKRKEESEANHLNSIIVDKRQVLEDKWKKLFADTDPKKFHDSDEKQRQKLESKDVSKEKQSVGSPEQLTDRKKERKKKEEEPEKGSPERKEFEEKKKKMKISRESPKEKDGGEKEKKGKTSLSPEPVPVNMARVKEKKLRKVREDDKNESSLLLARLFKKPKTSLLGEA